MCNVNLFLVKTRRPADYCKGYFMLDLRPRIVCNDGFSLSVQASSNHCCSPREDAGPYTDVEVGYPSARPTEDWRQYFEGEWQRPGWWGTLARFWRDRSLIFYALKEFCITRRTRSLSFWINPKDNATSSIYAYVPVQLVNDLIEAHGGIDWDETLARSSRYNNHKGKDSMSYTTVKAISPGIGTESLFTLKNSYGAAFYVWDRLARKHFGREMDLFHMDKVWKLQGQPDLPAHHKAVLMMTFDRAYVAKENYAQAAADIRLFLQDLPPDPTVVCHWPEISTFFETNPDYPGIGFHMTSVSDDPFDGPWNDEKECYDPPDWSTVFEVYAELRSYEDAHVS